MTDSGFLWMVAVGGWVGFLFAYIGFLVMAALNRTTMRLAKDILDDLLAVKDGSKGCGND